MARARRLGLRGLLCLLLGAGLALQLGGVFWWWWSSAAVASGPRDCVETVHGSLFFIAPQGAAAARQVDAWIRRSAPNVDPDSDVMVMAHEPCTPPQWLLEDPGDSRRRMNANDAPRERVLVLQDPVQAIVSSFAERGEAGMRELEDCVLHTLAPNWGDCGVHVNAVTRAMGPAEVVIPRFEFVDVWEDMLSTARLLQRHFPRGGVTQLAGERSRLQPSAVVRMHLENSSKEDRRLYNTVLTLLESQFDELQAPYLWHGRYTLDLDREPVSVRQQPGPNVYGVLATAAMHNYQEIFGEQWNQLLQTGLLERTDKLVVSVLGAPEATAQFRVPMAQRWTNAAVMRNEELTLWEAPALQKLHSMCVADPAGYAYYIHTKGVRSDGNYRSGGEHRTAWRRYMMYALAEHWRESLAELQAGAPAMGVLRYVDTGFGQLPHYSGNFWWASCEYLASLPSPMYYMVHHPPQEAGTYPIGLRFWGEFWIGQKGADKLHQCFRKREGDWGEVLRYDFVPRSRWETQTEFTCCRA